VATGTALGAGAIAANAGATQCAGGAIVAEVNLEALWREGQRGWPADYPIFQLPNAPLLVAQAAAVGARVSEGRVRNAARALSAVSLTVWAWQEVEQGPNLVRRGIGAAALAALVARLAGAGPR
jgi:hypothetical protein